MKFWDASALMPLLVDEARTGALRGLLKADEQVLVWWSTPVECASGLARRLRDGELDAEQHRQALKALVATMPGWRIVTATALVRYHAMRFVRLYPLRAGDGLQLAAATAWAEQQPGGLEFVCLDRRLSDAAMAEGFTVLPS